MLKKIKAIQNDTSPLAAIHRVFLYVSLIYPLMVMLLLLAGWQAAGSAAIGGGTILSLAWLTRDVVMKGMAAEKSPGKEIWWIIAPKILLLGLCLYAMLQTTWVELIPLTAGLSLFFPALLVEVLYEGYKLRHKKQKPE